jgi:two-component system cell cycle sensor histidine kinase/response regulator CckA
MADPKEHEGRSRPSEPERTLATLLANLPGVAYRCLNAPDWPMEFLSEGCLDLTGYPPEDLLKDAGFAFGDLIHPDDRDRVWREVQQAVEVDQPFTLEYRIRTADGQERTVWERGCAVRDEAGELVSLEGFIQDISDRVELERRSVQAQKLEALGQLAGGVVHDINNMLMVIRSFLEMAQIDGVERGIEDWAGPAVQAVERGAALTRQLLTISRQQPAEQREVDLGRLLGDCGALLQPLLGKRVWLELDLPDEPLRVLADPAQLQQVLTNLCINARDAMPDGGRIRLSCRRCFDIAPEPGAPCAVLEVADTGTGIDPAIQQQVFQPYFTTKAPEHGTGLGLSSVASIVQAHRGHIDLHSELGVGSRFVITLPLIPG